MNSEERTRELNDALAEECRQRRRASALYQVAQGIIVNIHLKDRLEIIAQALSSICDVGRCTIFLRRFDRLIAVSGWSPTQTESYEGVSIGMGENTGFIYEALLTGEPVLVPDAAKIEDIRAIVERCNIKGFLALPLVRKQHLVGVAVLDNPGEYPHFDREAVDSARGLATLAAIAIENSEIFEKWVNVGDSFQRIMLPGVPEQVGSLCLTSRYYAAVESTELGGDFYDYLLMPDGRIALVIADVAGKGLDAAVFTAMGKYTLRAFIREQADPGIALTRTNKALSGSAGEWVFVTMFCCVIDPASGKMVYASAGHPPPMVVGQYADVTELPCKDHQPPLGVLPDVEYECNEYALQEGDMLACYTDGVIEARRDGETYYIERLAEVLIKSRHLSPSEIADSIHSSVEAFSHGAIQDDIALLVVKRCEV